MTTQRNQSTKIVLRMKSKRKICLSDAAENFIVLRDAAENQNGNRTLLSWMNNIQL
ncbi:hypothetical protein BVRB_8g194620 [Beta vulgaris subsp. vulgaris]|nr:hypothetical protein BVRB_8g194620 [Beta vulgaris subsp. vulgaris]